MKSDEIDHGKRRLLTATATALGGVGAVSVAVPFVASMQPSARAQAAGAPIEIDISALRPGELVVHKWRGKPVWVLHRTEEMLASLKTAEEGLTDPQSAGSEQPDYALNRQRSLKPEYLVLVGVCTHLGCSPKFRPEPGDEEIGADWAGGFLCPCHGGRYDLAGRVFKGTPPPKNMAVPPYMYLSDSRLVIGLEEGEV
ncbi:MAG: ubiquinol-cytochrome c reductase iron-sulfur subunit [Gammaproteobacteria bacterium]|nr:ubiquinol-cytochrome c reductase iron-sulfur subunit [Gammaproteobacteria bacterium]